MSLISPAIEESLVLKVDEYVLTGENIEDLVELTRDTRPPNVYLVAEIIAIGAMKNDSAYLNKRLGMLFNSIEYRNITFALYYMNKYLPEWMIFFFLAEKLDKVTLPINITSQVYRSDPISDYRKSKQELDNNRPSELMYISNEMSKYRNGSITELFFLKKNPIILTQVINYDRGPYCSSKYMAELFTRAFRFYLSVLGKTGIDYDINVWIGLLRSLSAGGNGVTLKGQFILAKDLAVVKYEINPSADPLYHEFFVALVLRQFREKGIPNFVYPYAMFSCGDITTFNRDGKQIKLCIPNKEGNEPKDYIIYEYINGTRIVSFFNRKAQEEPENYDDIFSTVIKQIVYAMREASVILFQHGDLHRGNILIVEYPEPITIRYTTEFISSRYVPVIIDLGRGSLLHEGKFHGPLGGAYYRSTNPYAPLAEYLTLLMSINDGLNNRRVQQPIFDTFFDKVFKATPDLETLSSVDAYVRLQNNSVLSKGTFNDIITATWTNDIINAPPLIKTMCYDLDLLITEIIGHDPTDEFKNSIYEAETLEEFDFALAYLIQTDGDLRPLKVRFIEKMPQIIDQIKSIPNDRLSKKYKEYSVIEYNKIKGILGRV